MTERGRRPREVLSASPPPDAMGTRTIPIDAPPAGATRSEHAALGHLHLASPPREVLEAIARAAHAHRLLRLQGRELRFRLRSGRVAVELVDHVAGSSTTLAIAPALELAEAEGV